MESEPAELISPSIEYLRDAETVETWDETGLTFPFSDKCGGFLRSRASVSLKVPETETSVTWPVANLQSLIYCLRDNEQTTSKVQAYTPLRPSA